MLWVLTILWGLVPYSSFGVLGASNTLRLGDDLELMCGGVVSAEVGASPARMMALWPALRSSLPEGAVVVVMPEANGVWRADFGAEVDALVSVIRSEGFVPMVANVGPRYGQARKGTLRFNASRVFDIDIHSALAKRDNSCDKRYCTRDSHWTPVCVAVVAATATNTR